MNLRDWLHFKRKKRIEFAVEVGVSAGYLSDLCNGRCWPSREVAQRILDATGGDVTPSDFLQKSDGEAA